MRAGVVDGPADVQLNPEQLPALWYVAVIHDLRPDGSSQLWPADHGSQIHIVHGLYWPDSDD